MDERVDDVFALLGVDGAAVFQKMQQAADFRRKQFDFFGMVNPQHGRIGVQAAFGFGQLFQKVHAGQRLADAFVFKARFFQHFAQIVGLGEFLEIGKMFQ